MKTLIDINALRLLTRSVTPSHAFAPPHAMMETSRYYSIILNLLGIDQKNIAFAIDEKRRELTVLAKRENSRIGAGFFWSFNIPDEATMPDAEMYYKNGAVEIRIPKALEVA